MHPTCVGFKVTSHACYVGDLNALEQFEEKINYNIFKKLMNY